MKDRISVEVAGDKSRAAVMLSPKEGETVQYAEVILALGAKGVIHGILEDAIKEVVESKKYFSRFTAAVYTPPVQGIDAMVEFLISEETSLKVTEDGRVDYYGYEQFKIVTQGQPIVKKTPPTEGVAGVNVLGESLPSNEGKDIDLQSYIGAGGVAIDPTDPNQIIATRSGVYSRTGNYVEIKDVLTINHDIDFSVGSIDAPASLVVNGDIRGGFEIISEKDIRVTGVVENAYVKAGGNIEVWKGIVKGGANVEAGGKISTNYIVERKNVQAGEIEVKNTIIGSSVWAQKGIRARKIIGGRTVVGLKLEVFELGNMNGDATRVEIGVDAVLLTRTRVISKVIKMLKQRLRKAQEERIETQFEYEEASEGLEVILFTSRYGGSKQLISKLEGRLRLAGERINKFNTQIDAMEKELTTKMTELQEIAPQLAIENPMVIVRGTVFPNVTIKMGIVSEIKNKKERRNVCFSLDDDGRIMIEENQ
ncbi:MAG: DUF342 domain-containing protein [candidate division Zixibacteria bacterium]|nr:DUF342 domain-containing protein [Candidatus Tariuqbacter arcticus]